MRTFVLMIVGLFGLACQPAAAEEEPDWATSMRVVEVVARAHLEAIDIALEERNEGGISEAAAETLKMAHNALAVSLAQSAAKIVAKHEEMREAAINCMRSEEAFSDSCERRMDQLLIFTDWSIDALGGLANLADGLELSALLLEETAL